MAKKKKDAIRLAFVPLPNEALADLPADLDLEALAFVCMPVAVYASSASDPDCVQHATLIVQGRLRQLQNPTINVAPAARLLLLAGQVVSDEQNLAMASEATRFALSIIGDPTNISATPLFATAAELVTFWNSFSQVEPLAGPGAAAFSRAFAAFLGELEYKYEYPPDVQVRVAAATAVDDLADLLFAAWLRQEMMRAAKK